MRSSTAPRVKPAIRAECPACHKAMRLTRDGRIPLHGTLSGPCEGSGKRIATNGDYTAKQLAALARTADVRQRRHSIMTVTINGIPTSVDGALSLVDAEVTVDFALIAAECLGGATFGKLKKQATRMGGAIVVKATNARKA